MEIKDSTKMTLTELSKAIGSTPQAIGQWMSKGCPRNPDTTLDLAHVVQWRLQSAMASANNAGAQERYRAAKADQAELALAKERGQVIPTTEMNRIVGQSCQMLRNICGEMNDTLPDKLIGLPDVRAIGSTLHSELQRLQSEFSAACALRPFQPDEDTPDGEQDAAKQNL
jgi:phage terminase Nu1 subunit (DNA packaging protein)